MKIYLSSTFEDLRSERRDLRAALAAAGHIVVSMEDYRSFDTPPLDKCLLDIEGSDLYLGVVSWRYGDVPQEDELEGVSLPEGTQAGRTSFTEFEYRHASNLDLPRLLFLASDSTKRPTNGAGGSLELERIEELRQSIKDDRLIGTFSDADELVSQALDAVQKHRQESKSQLPDELRKRLRQDLIPVLEDTVERRRPLKGGAFWGAIAMGLASLGIGAARLVLAAMVEAREVTTSLALLVLSAILGMGWWKMDGCDHQLQVFRAAIAAGLRRSVRRSLSQMTCYHRFRGVLNDVLREIAAG